MTLNPNKVLVAMSGGVDSSVAAALLVEQGYETAGITITPFKITEECRVKVHERSCCSYQSAMQAAEISKQLGMEHYFIDHTELFRETVVNNFIDEYFAGRTPNPCVICNREIKWRQLLLKADEIGAAYLATGHYAKIRRDPSGLSVLEKGDDEKKDQSYFLWTLEKSQLARTMFPVGELEKSETRAIALKYGFESAGTPDSQEVCFIPDNDYRNFLTVERPEDAQKLDGGNFIFEGKVIGKHKGYPFYTVGQRKGLGISHSEPLFVKAIRAERNEIELARTGDLDSSILRAVMPNIQKYDRLPEDRVFNVKIRYRDPGAPAKIFTEADGSLRIEFLEPRRAVTPGQSVVFYEGNDLAGGAVISDTY